MSRAAVAIATRVLLVIFTFVLIVVLAAVMLFMRQRMHWNEAGGGA